MVSEDTEVRMDGLGLNTADLLFCPIPSYTAGSGAVLEVSSLLLVVVSPRTDSYSLLLGSVLRGLKITRPLKQTKPFSRCRS